MHDLPFYLLAFLIVLSVLIVVHELGHFLVARLCGVKVLRFSLGFGPVLWRRRLGADRTEWTLSALPLGGYVRMLDEREGEVAAHELPRAFNRQSVGRRSLIVLAGPLANFLLAFLIYWGLFWQGSEELLPVLGPPELNSPAAEAGVANGMLVLRVEGEAVASWQDFRWLLLRHAAGKARVELDVQDADGATRQVLLDTGVLAAEGWQGEPFARLGLRFYQPPLLPVVGEILPDSPGAAAGLRPGDRFLAIDGQPVTRWGEVVDAVRRAPGRALHVRLQRADRVFECDIVPQVAEDHGQRIGRIGVGVAGASDMALPELRTHVRHGFFGAAQKALRKTWEESIFSLQMFGKMLSGEASWRNLSGPVTIADYAGQSARQGSDAYLKFMALVSISLGVLNLLPIPILDGGHLMYHALEVIKGGALSESVMAWGQRIGVFLLFALMAFAFFNDLNRLLGPLFSG